MRFPERGEGSQVGSQIPGLAWRGSRSGSRGVNWTSWGRGSMPGAGALGLEQDKGPRCSRLSSAVGGGGGEGQERTGLGQELPHRGLPVAG